MKQYWKTLVTKIDLLSLRERVMVFAMAAVVLVALLNTAVIDPLYAKQKLFSLQVNQDQAQMIAIQTEIQQKIQAHQFDPDMANQIRLKEVKLKATKMNADLMEMQKGLVSPDKMAALLEDILKRNGNLRLVSLKTLSASNLSESKAQEGQAVVNGSAGGAAPVAQNNEPKKPADSPVFKHGVEIVVQGSYLDLLNYMTELETMPWQLFWGKVNLNVIDYPKSVVSG
ncbi:MSHA biogenesis protein MshJ [Sulfurirhabdus autotrophica]|uniref:MSHA biogenesis protein MshJ n=1 Tax=Sulfurirhabdus autotrophica TaxID=1706046 RepID=A0A4R3Y1B5_9PROT|nr:MSHA biogenesis protein MshJ [Sulfurirhabdus autotrophica]TCV85222.1 MSHA biogenesis protein MshJ [Sulfurirhabdus autotrophica]